MLDHGREPTVRSKGARVRRPTSQRSDGIPWPRRVQAGARARGRRRAGVDKSNVQWANYTKIQLMPVEFWAAADSKVSTADQAVLTEYFYNALQTNLSKSFTLVDQ